LSLQYSGRHPMNNPRFSIWIPSVLRTIREFTDEKRV
jgi:hypothetical protein